MTSQRVERTWIRTGGYGRFRGEWVKRLAYTPPDSSPTFTSVKVDKILGLTFFPARKDFEGFNTAFFHLLLLSFVVDGLFTTPVYSPQRAVLWTQRFLTRKIWPKNEVYLWQTNLKANVCRNFTFQVNTRKNATGRRHLTSRNRIAIFVSTSCE